MRKNKGFTLLELLIVVVILAILAGLALPQYLRTVARAREAEGWQMLGTVRSALSRYYAEWSDYTGVDFTSLDVADPNTATALFGYAIVETGTDFTITADPAGGSGACGGCRTLTLEQDGTRTETP